MKDLISAVTLLIGALGHLTQNALPPWIIVVVALCLVIVAIGLLYRPFALLLSRVVGKWRVRRLARTSFSEVLDTARMFQQLIAPQNTNTLLKVLELPAFQCRAAETERFSDSLRRAEQFDSSI
jgi:hypothetical protein